MKSTTCMAILSLFLYPISEVICIGVCLTALVLSIEQKQTLLRVMQPSLMLATVFFLRGLFGLILNIISTFASINNNYRGELLSNISTFSKILNGICLCFVLLYAIVVTILNILDKDEPLFCSLAKCILGQNINC